MTVFVGVSGSGKSSLVFDTIAAEAQRQTVDGRSISDTLDLTAAAAVGAFSASNPTQRDVRRRLEAVVDERAARWCSPAPRPNCAPRPGRTPAPTSPAT
jgi:hypothetical protein